MFPQFFQFHQYYLENGQRFAHSPTKKYKKCYFLRLKFKMRKKHGDLATIWRLTQWKLKMQGSPTEYGRGHNYDLATLKYSDINLHLTSLTFMLICLVEVSHCIENILTSKMIVRCRIRGIKGVCQLFELFVQPVANAKFLFDITIFVFYIINYS